MTAPVEARRGVARRTTVVGLVGAVAVLGACATTVDDDTGAARAPTQTLPPGASLAVVPGSLIEGGVIVDSVPETTVPTAGSAADLLPELAVEMSRLGTQVAEGDGDDETLARIESIWTAIRSEVETTHPELVNGIGATVDMARVAVERTRPADADKAFSILTDLVDRYTGDG